MRNLKYLTREEAKRDGVNSKFISSLNISVLRKFELRLFI